MASSLEFLDAVKVKHNLPSDYALAKILGLTRQAVSKYRHGHAKAMDVATAVKVAELLEIDALLVIAVAERERAHVEANRELWEKLVKKLGGMAAAVLLGAGLAGTPPPVQAGFNNNQMGEEPGQTTHMRTRRRQSRFGAARKAASAFSAFVRYASTARLPMFTF
ncbi:MAG: DUF3693 domain-containing protein [Nanoarchaeota archaeon]